jgi:hypothetical protein
MGNLREMDQCWKELLKHPKDGSPVPTEETEFIVKNLPLKKMCDLHGLNGEFYQMFR